MKDSDLIHCPCISNSDLSCEPLEVFSFHRVAALKLWIGMLLGWACPFQFSATLFMCLILPVWLSWAWNFGFFQSIFNWHSNTPSFIVFFDLFLALLLWRSLFWVWQRPGTFSHSYEVIINVGLPSVSCHSATSREPSPLCAWKGNHLLNVSKPNT